MPGGVLASLAVAYVLAPCAWAKIVLAAAGAALLSHRAAQGAALPRSHVLAAVGGAVWVAHVVSPYWLLAPSWPARIGALILVAIWTVLWSGLAATDVRWQPKPLPPWSAVAVAAALTALCAPALGAPLEFRGDEDLHLARALGALEALRKLADPHRALAAFLVSGLVVALLLWPRRARPGVLVCLAAAPVALAAAAAAGAPSAAMLVKLGRYPALSAWVHTLAAFSPLQWLPGFGRFVYDEALYRIVPLSTALMLGGWLLRVLKGTPFQRTLGAVTLATTPVVLYYATALYLELPAVVLITTGLYGLDVAARRAFREEEDTTGSALALSLGLLLKESAVPLGIAAVAVCGFWALRGRRPAAARFFAWARLAVVILGPILLYLAWRFSPLLQGERTPTLTWSPLANVELYRRLAGALVPVMGPFLVLAVVGVAAAVRRRPRAAALWVTTLGAMLLVLAGDSVRAVRGGPLPAFWGYSRFLLLTFPPLCCLAIEACRWLAATARARLTATLLIVLAGHLFLRPFGWDGSRPARWGDAVAETSGERYPYDDLYRWLAERRERGELWIVGRDYAYRDDFYLKKYGLDVRIAAPPLRVPRAMDVRTDDWSAAATRRVLEDLRRAAQTPEASIVVAQLRPGVDERRLPEQVGRLRHERTFRLGEHVLVAYSGGPTS
jgi:hypothetical protein